eukprot:6473724-Amphidinium_carterae.1
MLRATTAEAPAPEGMGPPPVPQAPQGVVLRENPAWQQAAAAAAKRDESPLAVSSAPARTQQQQTHSGPIKPLKQEPLETQQGSENHEGGSGRKDQRQRRSAEAPPSEFSGWSGTTGWGGSTWQKRRGLCAQRGETPVGTGALDEAFSLAAEAERATVQAERFAAVFLDCSKCYERVDLALLEKSAVEAGFPLEALKLALDMYRGRRRILVNGALSEPVVATSGIPAGCGLAVDLLHAFLQHKLDASKLKVAVRKYVDDMVLSASGKGCAFTLREAFKAVRRVLEDAGMQLNKAKCVVVANTDPCRRECRRAWDRMGVKIEFTTRDLGVDVQWGPWRNPVQQSRVKSFTAAMRR